MLAIIGGPPAHFAPFSQLFQQALEQFERAPLPVGVHSPGHVAVTDEQAQQAAPHRGVPAQGSDPGDPAPRHAHRRRVGGRLDPRRIRTIQGNRETIRPGRVRRIRLLGLPPPILLGFAMHLVCTLAGLPIRDTRMRWERAVGSSW